MVLSPEKTIELTILAAYSTILPSWSLPKIAINAEGEPNEQYSIVLNYPTLTSFGVEQRLKLDYELGQLFIIPPEGESGSGFNMEKLVFAAEIAAAALGLKEAVVQDVYGNGSSVQPQQRVQLVQCGYKWQPQGSMPGTSSGCWVKQL